jgi:choline dehydrogenase-like flavoprotein
VDATKKQQGTRILKMNKSKEPVVIIGGGLGGLSAACTLAARGYKVRLLEANSWVGGKAAVHRTRGFVLIWDRQSSRFHRCCTASLVRQGSNLRTRWKWFESIHNGAAFLAIAPLWTSSQMVRTWRRELMRSHRPQAAARGLGRRFLELSQRQSQISERVFFWRPIGKMMDMFSASDMVRPGWLKDVLSIRLGRTVSGYA